MPREKPSRASITFVQGPQGPAGPVSPDAVLTTGSYADPAWITSLAGAKITGSVPLAVLAAAATVLATPRSINGVAFDGSANITVPAAAGTLTGATLAAGVLASSLTSVGVLGALTVTAPIVGSVTGSSGFTTGKAATATVLAVARLINGVSFNGSADITITSVADAGLLTGATLAATVVASSLTSVGTLTSLKVSGSLSAGTAAAPPSGVEGYVVSTSASDPRGLMSAQYSTDTVGARIHLRKGRGTEAVPTTMVTGDVLGRIRFSGYDGANYLQSGSIDVVSTGTIAATRVPSYMAFSVATDAAPSVLTEMLRLTTTGMTYGGALNLGGVGAAGLTMQNTTPATAGVPVQFGPRFLMSGAAWDTVGLASHTAKLFLEIQPTSTSPIGGSINFGFQVDAGTITYPMIVSSTGNLTTLGTINMQGSQIQVAAGAQIFWGGRANLTSPANGQLKVTNNAISAGVGFDVSTDSLMLLRTRAFTGYATLDCLGLKASGVPGASFGPAAVASITVVNGIVTAIS
jgi:hypothetical protein